MFGKGILKFHKIIYLTLYNSVDKIDKNIACGEKIRVLFSALAETGKWGRKGMKKQRGLKRTLALLTALALLISCVSTMPMAVGAATGDGRCDLIVTDITWSPTNPAPGSRVVFSAVVKNAGTSPTPAGTIVGVRFGVNQLDRDFYWSDTYTESIAPGETVVLTANGGNPGTAVWNCGNDKSYNIMAWVDDVDRINETNNNNNTFTKTLTVSDEESDVLPEPCDLALMTVRATVNEISSRQPVRLLTMLKNNSDVDTPAGTSIPVHFYIDGRLVETVTVNEKIAAGATVPVQSSVTWKAVFGTHTLRAMVNTDEAIPESDYNNNRRAALLHVSDTIYQPVLPDLLPEVVPEAAMYEAEDAALTSARIASDHDGYSGAGFAANLQQQGSSAVAFTVQAEKAGKYELRTRYANACGSERTLALYVNGSRAETQRYAHQTYWNSWDFTTTTVTLRAGANTIAYRYEGGTSGNVNLDYITLEKATETDIVTSFSFTKEKNPQLVSDISCTIKNNKITATVPSTVDISSLVPTITGTDDMLVIGNQLYQEGDVLDFTSDVFLHAIKSGEDHLYTVQITPLRDTKLPNVYINLDPTDAYGKYILLNGNKPEDKEVKVNSEVTLELGKNSSVIGTDPDASLSTVTAQAAEVKLRGNSTLDAAKKAYKIKFDSKQKVLDMPKNKHWVLLANYFDKSLMRNYVALSLGQSLENLDWTPHMRYVNVFLDGEYLGNYLLGEHIRLDENRVNIQEHPEGSDGSQGGFLVELDERRGEVNVIDVYYNGRNYPFCVNTPDEETITPEQLNYLRDYLNKFMQSLNNPEARNYEEYIDVDSFVDWYLCNEVMMTLDASGWSSIYLHKDAGGKLKMGPVWDFDISSGNTNYQDNSPTSWWIRGSIWFGPLFQSSDFRSRVKARWNEIKAEKIDTIVPLIDQLAVYTEDSFYDNDDRWDTLHKYIWPTPEIAHSFDGEIGYFRSWMQARINWLDGQFNAL